MGIVTAVRRHLETGDLAGLGNIGLVAGVLVFILLALVRLRSSGGLDHERAALVVLSVGAFSLQAGVWLDMAGAMRVLAEAVGIATILVLSSREVSAAALTLLVATWATACAVHTLFL